MYTPGKIQNTVQEMKRMSICVLGINEIRWPQSGRCTIDDHIVYYSGTSDTQHRNGVGFVLTKETDAAVVGFIPLSDRIAMLETQASPVNINLIQIYAPTGESEEEVVESFYKDLGRLMEQLRKRNVTMVMGDWNAKVGG
ncbi:craniofacial development protein 2-like [Polyergus mexicanus]|uniref:craniofacial development protein 2-like n=1 Tax=Polyergus mexicanus TaxID=615972 RepID=UPI0038B67836